MLYNTISSFFEERIFEKNCGEREDKRLEREQHERLRRVCEANVDDLHVLRLKRNQKEKSRRHEITDTRDGRHPAVVLRLDVECMKRCKISSSW